MEMALPGRAVVRLSKTLLAAQFAAVILIAALAIFGLKIGNPAVALLVGLGAVLLTRLLVTANNFVLSRRHGAKAPHPYRLNWWKASLLLLSEYRATMTSSSWTMIFRTFDLWKAPEPSALPVLLIHGYGCNSGYWHPLSKTLRRAGITHAAIDMEPVFAGIDEYAPQIQAAANRLRVETGRDRIVIIGHSMGGLAARAFIRQHGSSGIARVITLGTPHHGTALARFGVGLNTEQMRWTAGDEEGLASEWLQTLATEENEQVRKLFVSIYSHHDNIISPQISSRLPGAENIEFGGIGHVNLVFHSAIQTEVIAQIEKASAESTESGKVAA